MKNLLSVLLLGVLILTGCADEPERPQATPEPTTLLQQVIDNLRTVENFQMLIEQTGAPFAFGVTLDQGQSVVNAVMPRGEATYVSPETLYANVRLRLSGLPPIGVDIFAEGADQWFKLAGTNWINYPVAEGFDPGALVEEDGGFESALTSLNEVEYIAATTLPGGLDVHHVRGTATGQVINDLLFDLVDVEGEVIVNVYVNRESNLPALLEVTLPDTETDDHPEPTRWRIEVFNVNAEVNIPDPQAQTTPNEAENGTG